MAIERQLIQDTLDYMVKQPYGEVVDLLGRWKTCSETVPKEPDKPPENSD